MKSNCVGSVAPAVTLCVAGCWPPDSNPEPCAPRLPQTVSVIEGGRLVLDHDGDVIDASGADMSIRVGADDVSLRAPLGAGVYPLLLHCAQSERKVEVAVTALGFSSVASWEPDDTVGLPAGREYFAWWMSPRPNEAAVYLYGGFGYEPAQFTLTSELFRFDLLTSTWTSVAQHGDRPLPGGRVATAPSGEVRYFGGASLDGQGTLDTPPAFYSWTIDDDGGVFAPAPIDGAPGSYTGSLWYDERRARWLSVCGADTVLLGLHCEVHSFTAAEGWQSLAVAGEVPRGRMGFHAAYDDEGDRLVVYGGEGEAGPLGDVWTLALGLDTPRWTPHPSSGGLARRNGAYAFDPIGRRLVVWGGTANGRTALPGVDLLTLDDDALGWQHVEPEGPPPRASGQCLFDEGAARLLCGFGNARSIYTDLWALPLTTSEPESR
jgi:hypothetical protein